MSVIGLPKSIVPAIAFLSAIATVLHFETLSSAYLIGDIPDCQSPLVE